MKQADALGVVLPRLPSNASVRLERLNRGRLTEEGGELLKLGKVGLSLPVLDIEGKREGVDHAAK